MNKRIFFKTAVRLVIGLMPIAASILFAEWGFHFANWSSHYLFFITMFFVLGISIAFCVDEKKNNLLLYFIFMLLASSISIGGFYYFIKSHHLWAEGIFFIYLLIVVGMFVYQLIEYRRNVVDFNTLLTIQNRNDLRDIKSFLEGMDEKEVKQDKLVREDFIVHLTIEGTEYEDVEVKIEDPCRSIHSLINNIIRVFNLPMVDAGGNPHDFILGKIYEGEDDPVIFEKEDEGGNELCLLDYDVASGDHLVLIRSVLSGQ